MAIDSFPLALRFSENAEKKLRNIDGPERKRIVEKIKKFAETGVPPPKSLKGKFDKLKRIRIFDNIRVIVEIKNGGCLILDIEGRDSAYD